MEETYTFSRALHLMRYGGKKMRCVDWSDDCYAISNGNKFVVYDGSSWESCPTLSSKEIMGSWVEVKL